MTGSRFASWSFLAFVALFVVSGVWHLVGDRSGPSDATNHVVVYAFGALPFLLVGALAARRASSRTQNIWFGFYGALLFLWAIGSLVLAAVGDVTLAVTVVIHLLLALGATTNLFLIRTTLRRDAGVTPPGTGAADEPLRPPSRSSTDTP